MGTNEDNSEKNERGYKGMDSLDNAVDSFVKREYIVRCEKKYRIGDPRYSEDQFYFQFLIEFEDNEQWILHHTTSIRDRILEQQWNSEHIKRLNSYVKKAYVVVPDGLKEKEQAIADNYNDKIVNKKIYSALDGVVSLESIYNMVEKKAAGLMESGKAHAILGLHFEEKLVDALNNVENWNKWRNSSSTSVGYLFTLFKDVMEKFELNPKTVLSVSATNSIPKLKSGGMPKTDVLVKVNTTLGQKTYTISCKRSSASRVTVHEYTADMFAQVLNPHDNELREVLIEFQNAGGINAMMPQSVERMSNIITSYREKLERWVLGGEGGEGDPETQWANYIIAVDEDSDRYSIKTLEEYIAEYDKQGVSGQFGTPFQWTYPSGGKGKRIQLKGKLI